MINVFPGLYSATEKGTVAQLLIRSSCSGWQHRLSYKPGLIGTIHEGCSLDHDPTLRIQLTRRFGQFGRLYLLPSGRGVSAGDDSAFVGGHDRVCYLHRSGIEEIDKAA